MNISNVNFRDSKCICLHGLKISHAFKMSIKINSEFIGVSFIPHNVFVNTVDYGLLINPQNIVKCDIVVVVNNCCHNLFEVQIVKMAVSMIYFANRMKLAANYQSHQLHKINDYFNNYHIDGYYGIADGRTYIEHASWFVKLGNSLPQNDDYDMWMTRVYGYNQCDEYDRRDGLEKCIQFKNISIDIDSNLIKQLEKIQDKVNRGDLYSNKLLSAFRLYYSLLSDFNDFEQNDISFCTILESLLLGKDESNQRKKASVRAACIVANDYNIKNKRFIANQVYYFYHYRNCIIHDGKSILDFDEAEHRIIHQSIKHIIFYIIQYIIENDVRTPDEIKSLVQHNISSDSLINGFDYIESEEIDNNGSSINVLIFNE